jgi:hypothetical protein
LSDGRRSPSRIKLVVIVGFVGLSIPPPHSTNHSRPINLLANRLQGFSCQHWIILFPSCPYRRWHVWRCFHSWPRHFSRHCRWPGLLHSFAGSTAVLTLCPHRRDSHATFGDPATWVYVSPPNEPVIIGNERGLNTTRAGLPSRRASNPTDSAWMVLPARWDSAWLVSNGCSLALIQS